MKQRNSNIESLRIIAMVLVLVVHATFIGTGFPSIAESTTCPISSFCRFGFGALSIVCVNLFVLISGWFGIHFNLKKFISFILTAIFYALLVYIVLLLLYPQKYLNWTSASTILMLNSSDYWFIKSYILLYFFAPILNSFIEQSDEKQQRLTLITFYIFQTVYAWLSIYGAADFQGGYSVLSFMGLYLLAHYFHRYPGITENWSAKLGIRIFFGIALFHASLGFLITRLGLPIAGRIFTYTNPLVIIQSLSLLIGFSKLSFQNKLINWVASSCLAVYLLHANELILRPYYGTTIKNWYLQENLLTFLFHTVLFISLIFIASILVDKIRNRLFQIMKLC